MTDYYIVLILLRCVYTKSFKNLNTFNDIPRPHPFVTKTLQSDLNVFQIATEMNVLLPAYEAVITQFNNLLNESNTTVFKDFSGNTWLSIPQDLPELEIRNLSARFKHIDHFLAMKDLEIFDMLQTGWRLEFYIKREDPNYVSQLTDKVAEFQRLRALYR